MFNVWWARWFMPKKKEETGEDDLPSKEPD